MAENGQKYQKYNKNSNKIYKKMFQKNKKENMQKLEYSKNWNNCQIGWDYLSEFFIKIHPQIKFEQWITPYVYMYSGWKR